jgi:hypothetical protein
VPVHNARFNSNWELSTERAVTVVALLVEHHGFDPSLVSAAGYSEYRPVSQNSTEQGRADNRRVDLVVVGRSPEKDKMAQQTPAAAPVPASKPVSVRASAPALAPASASVPVLAPVGSKQKPSPIMLRQVSAPPKTSR